MKRLFSITVLTLAALALAAGPTWARPPLISITPIPDLTAQATVPFAYQASYTVDDPVCFGEFLGFALDFYPTGMTISYGGAIHWTPTDAQAGGNYVVTVKATASRLAGSPCYGGTQQAWKTFAINVLPAPGATPPTAPVEVELSETALNNVLATLTEVRGLNYGKYVAGFIDAWWVNVDQASIDVLEPVSGHNRVRLNVAATGTAVVDLFIIQFPAVVHASGWIDGDVNLIGTPATGYKIVVHPTDMSLFFSIISDLTAADISDVELNLGTQITPLFACARPALVTNATRTGLLLQWSQSSFTTACAQQQEDDAS
jgi:Putative Ig domain